MSSSLNALAAATWEDVMKSQLDHLSQYNKAIIAKVLGKIFNLTCSTIYSGQLDIFSMFSAHRASALILSSLN